MTSIEIVVIVVLMIVTVSLLSVVSYSRKVKKEAALVLARENAQKEKDRLHKAKLFRLNEEEAYHARLVRQKEKETIKQWWANPNSSSTEPNLANMMVMHSPSVSETKIETHSSTNSEPEQSTYTSSYSSSGSDSSYSSSSSDSSSSND